MWDDDPIDAAMGEIAHVLAAGDPGPEFRARVMARIDRTPTVSLSWRMVAAGVAVAAIVAIAVMVRPKLDTTYESKPNATEVRLPPSPENGFGGPRKPDAAEGRLKPAPPYV